MNGVGLFTLAFSLSEGNDIPPSSWYVTDSEPLQRMQCGLREALSPCIGSAPRSRGGVAGEYPDIVQVGLDLGPGRWNSLHIVTISPISGTPGTYTAVLKSCGGGTYLTDT